MAVDFFRLLDIRNRRAFSQAGRDGLSYRTALVQKTLEIEKDLRNVLPSNYRSTIGGPNYTIALRAYAVEFARIRLAIDALQGDTYINNPDYCNTRADLAYQKIGSLLALNKNLKLSIFDSYEFCQFALSLVAIFFGGSTPANIVAGIERFVGEEGVVTLTENFIQAKNIDSAYDISDQFGFTVDFELTEQISRNFTDIGIKLDFLLKLIKPAHTLYVLRFLFTDIAEVVSGADDTIVAENIWNHGYEEARKYCAGVRGRDRLGTNTVQYAEEDFSGMAGTVIWVTDGPISRNQTLPRIGDARDVVVLVDGSEVAVSEVAGPIGRITLASPVTTTQTVVVQYYYWHHTAFGLFLGQKGRVLGSGRNTKYPVTWVLGGAKAKNPTQVTWQYGGWQRDYTASLGSPGSLLLGQPRNQISDDSGRVYAHRHVLGWGNYVTTGSRYERDLNEGTPLVELREAYNDIFEFDSSTRYTEEEGWGEQAWGTSTWGNQEPELVVDDSATLTWQITRTGGHFVDPLTVTTTEEGEDGLLSIACEGRVGVTMGTYEDAYDFDEDLYCDADMGFTFNVSNLNGDDPLNGPPEGCRLDITLSAAEPYQDTADVPSSATDSFESASVGGTESRGESYDDTGFFVFNESELNGSDVLFDNEILGHYSDEGYIVIDLGGTITHLPSYSLDQVAGLP